MNRKYITANLTVLKCWLIGGQNNNMGGHCEGFNTFLEFANEIKTRQQCQELILHFIDEEGMHPSGGDDLDPVRFEYWGDSYKFKRPSPKGLDKLTDRIWAKVQEVQKEYNSEN